MPKTKQKSRHSWRSLASCCPCVFPSWWQKQTMGEEEITLKPLNSCIHVFNSNQEMPSPTRCTVKCFLHKVIHTVIAKNMLTIYYTTQSSPHCFRMISLLMKFIFIYTQMHCKSPGVFVSWLSATHSIQKIKPSYLLVFIISGMNS